jgi:hypothetical protein
MDHDITLTPEDFETGSFLALIHQSAAQAVPLTILTGFLGAGKTTSRRHFQTLIRML